MRFGITLEVAKGYTYLYLYQEISGLFIAEFGGGSIFRSLGLL